MYRRYSVSDWKNRPMNLIVNQEAAIYSKEIRDNLPCAILVPVRLGLEYINPEYVRNSFNKCFYLFFLSSFRI